MEKMSKESIQAKLDVIAELMEELQEAMGGEVKGGLEEMLASKLPDSPMLGEGKDLKQVTVAAPDEESLEEGLEMAKEMTPKMAEMSPEDESKPEMEDEEEDDLYSQMKRKKAAAKKMA
jgi:hypothetical protein